MVSAISLIDFRIPGFRRRSNSARLAKVAMLLVMLRGGAHLFRRR
jgi:hypothetical protein